MNKSYISGKIVTTPKLNIMPMDGENLIICSFVISNGSYDTRKEAQSEEKNQDFFECFCLGNVANIIANYYERNSTIFMTGKFKNFVFKSPDAVSHFCNVFFVESIDSEEDVEKAEEPVVSERINQEVQIDELYQKVLDNGFSVIEEGDYYRLAMQLMA